MDAISGFLRDNNIPTSFDEIHHHLKAELKGVWQHAVRPNGPGSISPDAYDAALSADRPELQRRFNEAFATTGAGALLFPTTPCTAPLIESQYQFSIAGKDVSYVALAKNTVPASGAGLPGISIPMGFSSNGLPIGLEMDAPLGHDRRLLALARRVEAWCND
jgi:mandelamide amidase